MSAITVAVFVSKSSGVGLGLMADVAACASLVAPGIELFVGICLLVRAKFIRLAARIWCGIQIALALPGLIAFALDPRPPTGISRILILDGVLNITTGGLLIYLIGETD